MKALVKLFKDHLIKFTKTVEVNYFKVKHPGYYSTQVNINMTICAIRRAFEIKRIHNQSKEVRII